MTWEKKSKHTYILGYREYQIISKIYITFYINFGGDRYGGRFSQEKWGEKPQVTVHTS